MRESAHLLIREFLFERLLRLIGLESHLFPEHLFVPGFTELLFDTLEKRSFFLVCSLMCRERRA